jgi:alpha-ribazole phosphatase
MKLYLIRHGRTYDKDKFYMCGSTDLALTAGGITELEALKAKGGYPDIKGVHLYTTGMKRSEQTLQVLYGDVKHDVLTDLREIDFGDFEMYERTDPRLTSWLAEHKGMIQLPFPNGESIVECVARAKRALVMLLSKSEDALVVGHGALIQELVNAAMPDVFSGQIMQGRLLKYGYGYAIEIIDGKPVSGRAFPDANDYLEESK